MAENFVDIIGYQLEKIHTGMIAWLLDSESSPLPVNEQAAVLQKLAPNFFNKAELVFVNAVREYSFGRSRRIDLVLEVNFRDIKKAYLLIECKTDSDVSVEQLRESAKAFSAKNPKIPFSVSVLAVGTGQFTIKHQLQHIQELGFNSIDLRSALEIFSELSITGKSRTYDEWIVALKAEQARAVQIDKTLADMNHPWDIRLFKSGYRKGFAVFYMYYNKLREHLENALFSGWAIYSGSNNPVMNWRNGWVKVDSIQIYWEFNWNAFCLKAAVEEKSTGLWTIVRPRLIDLCKSSPVPGRKAANKRGTWVTAYKWNFDFCKETPSDIAAKTNDILMCVHERLQTIA